MNHDVDILTELLVDSFLAAAIIPFQGELVLPSLLAFGEYVHSHIFMAALLGSMLGSLANWLVGHMSVSMLSTTPKFDDVSRLGFSKVKQFFNRYLVWCLLFSWVPLIGGLVPLFAGICRARFVVVVGLLLAGKIAYYAVRILLS